MGGEQNNENYNDMSKGLKETKDTIIKEKFISQYPIPINIGSMTTILEQMKYCVCKIYNDNGNGSGFFCKILSENENRVIPVLITNFHVLNQKHIKENRKICFSFYDDIYKRSIIVDNDRRVYFEEKKYDITIIEIKNKDNIKIGDNINNYLELDEKIFIEKGAYLSNSSIYNISYSITGKACVSYGLLKSINDIEIEHLCSTEKGSSGSPILNLLNNKVIGIHKSCENTQNCNIGSSLIMPINEFINNKYNLNNYIQKNNDIYLNNPKNDQNMNEFNVNMNNNNYNKSYSYKCQYKNNNNNYNNNPSFLYNVKYNNNNNNQKYKDNKNNYLIYDNKVTI